MEEREQHTQTCSQRRDRKRKNPTPEKIEAMCEKVLTFVTEEPPEDIVTYPVVPSQIVDVSGKHDDRLTDNTNILVAAHCTKTPMVSIVGGLPKNQSINYVPTGRPRGRPRLNKSDVPKTKKPLGRPRIHAPVTQERKRPPGRPRIHPVKDPSMKKPRGRPRKNPVVFAVSHAQEDEIKRLMTILAEKDAEICLLRRRLDELGEIVPPTDTQKLHNNDVTVSKQCFVYVNPDGSIQDVNSPAVPCSDRVVDSAKYIKLEIGLKIVQRWICHLGKCRIEEFHKALSRIQQYLMAKADGVLVLH